ncbi:hypothetical protein MUN76_13425 [Leucobacter rhizosphaerae]|uniref:Uncharacterized protein n=1 Tax=Leucobacter rhizosphaerae TaxID=2932245 RepID=A0ABY4FUS0_9MICO|nr:hypothetical protein [Leucobacter rhizosphaerae]UOQ60028.1 hypothetical protein MUN76_13425 [Leucobacter rhizosphaerae]
MGAVDRGRTGSGARVRALVAASISDEALTVSPRGIWKVWSFCRRRRIPLAEITDVRVSDRPLTEVPAGLRIAGLDIVSILAGYFQRSGERSWWCARRGRSATVVRTIGPTLTTFVFSSADDAVLVAQLRARGIGAAE